MSLIVQMNNSPYDDKDDRTAVKDFFTSKDFDIRDNKQNDGIDLHAMKNGKIYAVEVGHDIAWPKGDVLFDHAFIEIPKRKWVHFNNAFEHPEKILCDIGIYCFISIDRTCIMFLDFKDLLQIDTEDILNGVNRVKHGKQCPMIKVPTSLVKRIEKLNNETTTK